MKKNKYKYLVLIFLLLLCNIYLLRKGLWLYKDISFWFKNKSELLFGTLDRISAFNSLGYYHGYDVGIFGFTKIIASFFYYLFFYLLGSELSQIAFIISAYLLSFISFYLFLSIFFKNKIIIYILSLLYLFNPLFFSLLNQSYIHIYASIPLFIYSFYKYYSEKLYFKFLLINIFSLYLLISYLRFIQIGFFVILPYIIYILLYKKIYFNFKRNIILFFSYFFMFSPSISLFLLQKKYNEIGGVENFVSIFKQNITKIDSIKIFNIFQTNNISLYDSDIYLYSGIFLFIFIIISIIYYKKIFINKFFLLNYFLFILGITFLGLSNVFGNFFYLKIIPYLPFLQNVPFYGFYILNIPLIIIIGLVTNNKRKYLYIYSLLFLILSIFPLLNINNKQLLKLKNDTIPQSYKDYFTNSYNEFPEATYYFPGKCWKAEYMKDTPSYCINYGLKYKPIQQNNARILTGENYLTAKELSESNNININNLQITHNLKNIIIANDLISDTPGDLNSDKNKINNIINAKQFFENNISLNVVKNNNFNHYFFNNKNEYDFFIYSPEKIYDKQNTNLFDNSLNILQRPVILEEKINYSLQSPLIFIKSSPFNPTIYYLKISNFDHTKPIIIQMNQSYGKAWKIKFIDEFLFNDIKCIKDPEKFIISNNEKCIYKNNIFSFFDFRLFNKQELTSQNHFIGNFIGNAWIIKPNNLPGDIRNSDYFYMAIIYEKQIYFSLSIIIFAFSFTILIFLTFYQEIINILKNKIIKK